MSILIPGFTRVYVPDMITVHLDEPDENAENVTVPFIDYIKNVASSELYPTWPENALRANIYAIISIALNRVFTEWYRNKGYNFDLSELSSSGIYLSEIIQTFTEDVQGEIILPSTQLIQYFINVLSTHYNTIPAVEINGYWNEETENAVMEFQKVANLPITGISDEQTWKSMYASAAGVLSNIPPKALNLPRFLFPNLIYQKGSEGSGVYVLQQYLAYISLSFPDIPAPKITGIFDEETEISVKAFQQAFNLNPDGIVEKITWETMARLYESLKANETDIVNLEPEL